jgi:hypothetical protein
VGYIIIIYSAFNLVFVTKEFRIGAVGWLDAVRWKILSLAAGYVIN